MDLYSYLICLGSLIAMVSTANRSLPPLDKQYTMPASCEDKNVCLEKLDDYPEDRIKQVLEGFENIEDDIGSPVEFGDREGVPSHGSCGSDDCPTTCSKEGDLAYYIRDTNDQIRIVIQSENVLTQIVTLRWCEKEGAITEPTQNIVLPWQYGLSCVTKYMDFEFFVLSKDHTKVERAKPKNGIPVCCICLDETAMED